jgi:hypothetical protein
VNCTGQSLFVLERRSSVLEVEPPLGFARFDNVQQFRSPISTSKKPSSKARNMMTEVSGRFPCRVHVRAADCPALALRRPSG